MSQSPLRLHRRASPGQDERRPLHACSEAAALDSRRPAARRPPARRCGGW